MHTRTVVMTALMALPMSAVHAANMSTAHTANGWGLRFEASCGWGHEGSNDGVWYDSASGPHKNNLSPHPCVLSVSGIDTGFWKLNNLRVSLVELGHISNSAEWGAYERSVELANPELSRKSVYGAYGSGNAIGVSVGKAWEKPIGKLTLGIEGGLFLYHERWEETYWRLSDPEDKGHDVSSNINLTTYGGLTAQYQLGSSGVALFGEYRHYWKVMIGLAGKGADTLTTGVSIPF